MLREKQLSRAGLIQARPRGGSSPERTSVEKENQPLALQTISVDKLEEEGKNLLDEILAQQQTTIIWDFVYQLPADYRQVLILRYKDGLSYAEIALQLRRTVNACRTLHGRAMKKLREIVHKEITGSKI